MKGSEKGSLSLSIQLASQLRYMQVLFSALRLLPPCSGRMGMVELGGVARGGGGGKGDLFLITRPRKGRERKRAKEAGGCVGAAAEPERVGAAAEPGRVVYSGPLAGAVKKKGG